METAVKIPDLEDDQNQQPFVTDFDFIDSKSSAYSGLYHWFGLEPVGDERTSLTFSGIAETPAYPCFFAAWS